MKKKIAFAVMAVIVLILTISIPVSANEPVEVNDFNVEIVSGGQVGIETTIEVTMRITAEVIVEPSRYKDMAVCQSNVNCSLMNNWLSMIDNESAEMIVRDYEYPSYSGPGAHAVLDWQPVITLTWTPSTPGPYYIFALVDGHTGATDGSWPPRWIDEDMRQYYFGTVYVTY